jgi:hypothetical protein
MEEKKTYNSRNAKWWLPNRTELIMLTVAILTLIVSILTQANNAINNLLKFEEIYKDLYPVLNAAHLLVILYVIYNLYDIKQLLPEPEPKSTDTDGGKTTNILTTGLKTWMKNYVGAFYYDKNDDKFIEKLFKTANKNINQLYGYWIKILGWLFIVYVVEFITSITPEETKEDMALQQGLLSLVIFFNNIVTVYWLLIYLKLNLSDEAPAKANKITDGVNRCVYWLKHHLSLSGAFGKEFNYAHTKKNITGWGILCALIFLGITAFLIYFTIYSDVKSVGYKSVMYLSILLGACSMLAAFSRLGGGTLRIPVSALLIMLFYSAVQPLFFAEKDFGEVDIRSGQLLFIINLTCLIGKFALLYIIKWIFSDYRIAYYFINEQITRNKTIEDSRLKEIFP